MVDQIGHPGSFMTTDGWDVAGIVEATRDHRLTRKCVVTHGNCGAWAASAGTSAANSQWEVSDWHRAHQTINSHAICRPPPPPPPSPPPPPPPPQPPAPTNITFRLNVNGQFPVQPFSAVEAAVNRTICCTVAGDFNGWDGGSVAHRIYDHDGDGIFEATIEIPAPPLGAVLRTADEPPAEQLASNGWVVLNNTGHWRYKFVAFGWAQQEAYGVGVPLPDDVSCLLGPTYGV